MADLSQEQLIPHQQGPMEAQGEAGGGQQVPLIPEGSANGAASSAPSSTKSASDSATDYSTADEDVTEDLYRLAKESTSWGEWNVSELYETGYDIPADLLSQLDLRKEVSVQALEEELRLHEKQLDEMRRQSRGEDAAVADADSSLNPELLSLEELSTCLDDLVSDLTAKRDRLVQQVDLMRQMDNMTRDTEALCLDDATVETINQMALALSLSQQITGQEEEDQSTDSSARG